VQLSFLQALDLVNLQCHIQSHCPPPLPYSLYTYSTLCFHLQCYRTFREVRLVIEGGPAVTLIRFASLQAPISGSFAACQAGFAVDQAVDVAVCHAHSPYPDMRGVVQHQSPISHAQTIEQLCCDASYADSFGSVTGVFGASQLPCTTGTGNSEVHGFLANLVKLTHSLFHK